MPKGSAGAEKTSRNLPTNKKKKDRETKRKLPYTFEKRGIVKLGSKNPQSPFYMENPNDWPAIGHWGVVTKGEVSLDELAVKFYGHKSFRRFISSSKDLLSKDEYIFWPIIEKTLYQANPKIRFPIVYKKQRQTVYPNIEKTTKFSFIKVEIHCASVGECAKTGIKADLLVNPEFAFYVEVLCIGKNKYPIFNSNIVKIDKFFEFPSTTVMPFIKYIQEYDNRLRNGYICGPVIYDPSYPKLSDPEFFDYGDDKENVKSAHNVQSTSNTKNMAAPKNYKSINHSKDLVRSNYKKNSFELNKPVSSSTVTKDLERANTYRSIREEIELYKYCKSTKNKVYVYKDMYGAGKWYTRQSLVIHSAKQGFKKNLIISSVIAGVAGYEEFQLSKSYKRAFYVSGTNLAKSSISTFAGIAVSWLVAAWVPGIGWGYIALTSIAVSFSCGILLDDAQEALEGSEEGVKYDNIFIIYPEAYINKRTLENQGIIYKKR